MKFEGVTKRYGGVCALDGVTFDLAEGEITAILGESGAGKSTLLGAIAGLISYDGTIGGVGGEKPVRRTNCSYLFQEPKLLPNLTAEENLKFVLPKGEWEKIPAMLARVGLGGREKSRPAQLSGGERRRVAVARAFLYPHDLLLMDEPFASLDLALKRSMAALVTELWQERGDTVVFVTHDVHEAALLSTRAVVLKKGRIAADEGNPLSYPRDFSETYPAERALTEALLRE